MLFGVYPAIGTTDEVVSLDGYGFDPASRVTFGGIDAREVTVIGPNRIQCRPPAGLSAGSYDVVVEIPDDPTRVSAEQVSYVVE